MHLTSQQQTCELFNPFSSTSENAGDAGSVCSGQQSRRSNAAETGGADRPQPKSYTGQ